MAEKKARPGVMLYFDSIRPALKRLDDSQCGVLLRAIIDYSEFGVIPELDPMTGMVFDMLIPKLDHDAKKYEESREQRQYAVYVRDKQKNGEPYLKIAEWRLSKYKPPDNDSIGPTSPDNGSIGPYPSISVSPSVSPSIPVSPSISPSTYTAGEVTGEGYKGEGEGEHQRLYAEWLSALDEKNNSRACELGNRLFALGYRVDKQSRKMTRR